MSIANASQMGQKDERRSQIMRILRAGGALEHYTRLQEELSRSQAEVEALRRNLELAEEVENRKTTAAIERKQLYQRLQQDHHEQRETITEAILTFEELSSALYEKAGHLTISATENGPKFDVSIEASRSLGINNMQIFCFDMMITILSQRRGRGPGFLIHDSHLFDGVDERQIAKALQLGAEKAEQYGFQYIVTMNSDDLPTEGFQNDFDIQKHVVEPRLTDKTDTGGLFGLGFSGTNLFMLSIEVLVVSDGCSSARSSDQRCNDCGHPGVGQSRLDSRPGRVRSRRFKKALPHARKVPLVTRNASSVTGLRWPRANSHSPVHF